MRRLTLTLSDEERDALRELATVNRRDTRAQAAYELRRALEAHGLLPTLRASAAGAKTARRRLVFTFILHHNRARRKAKKTRLLAACPPILTVI
jgi:hypothetical protein